MVPPGEVAEGVEGHEGMVCEHEEGAELVRVQEHLDDVCEVAVPGVVIHPNSPVAELLMSGSCDPRFDALVSLVQVFGVCVAQVVGEEGAAGGWGVE